MRGWSAFTKNGDDDKKIKSTISNRKAKKINVENISAVQEKDGKKFVVETGDNEYYDPSKKDSIGGKNSGSLSINALTCLSILVKLPFLIASK